MSTTNRKAPLASFTLLKPSEAERQAVERLAEEIRTAPCSTCGGVCAWWQTWCDDCNAKYDPDGAEEDRKGL